MADRGFDTAVSKELGMLKHPVHDRLEGGQCIGEPKGKHPEPVVPERHGPECSLGSVRLLQAVSGGSQKQHQDQ